MPYRICFIINTLSVGGAQMMLFKLLSRIDRTQFEPEVITLADADGLVQRLAEINVPTWSLGMGRGFPDPRCLSRLAIHLRRSRPDLVQTWMYHADLIGGSVARLCTGSPVVWNIRHSNLDPTVDKRSTFATVKMCAALSRLVPARIICCAHEARSVHAQFGYAAERMQVIPNGFDLTQFHPDEKARLDVRRELSLGDDALVIGYASRYHPQKDHDNFFRAAGLLRKSIADVRFVLCGDDVTPENRKLADTVRAEGLTGTVHLLGRRTDVARLTAAFDVATLASACGEGFPNTVGEAMACAVPCVVTDVGDSAMIVGEFGEVVPPRNPAALAGAWDKLLRGGKDYRLALGRAARQRIHDCYSLEAIVEQYQALYLELLSPVRGVYEMIATCKT